MTNCNNERGSSSLHAAASGGDVWPFAKGQVDREAKCGVKIGFSAGVRGVEVLPRVDCCSVC